MNKVQIITALILLFVPSYFLKMDRTAHMYILPQSAVEVGELIISPLDNNYDLRLNTKRFEAIRNTNKGFSVVGLTTGFTETINAFSTETTYNKFLQPKREWLSQRLPVNRPPLAMANDLRLPSDVWKRVNNDEQRKIDAAVMHEVLSKYDERDDLFACMQLPLRSLRVSKFASPRNLPNGRQYYHSGVDFRAFVPTPLSAMAAGEVVFSDFMLVPGNLVVISHGKGLFSRYMHLSKLNVKVGDIVKAGQNVGLTGGTGRVEAPHLHWEIIWKGNHANPENFLLQWERICGQS